MKQLLSRIDKLPITEQFTMLLIKDLCRCIDLVGGIEKVVVHASIYPHIRHFSEKLDDPDFVVITDYDEEDEGIDEAAALTDDFCFSTSNFHVLVNDKWTHYCHVPELNIYSHETIEFAATHGIDKISTRFIEPYVSAAIEAYTIRKNDPLSEITLSNILASYITTEMIQHFMRDADRLVLHDRKLRFTLEKLINFIIYAEAKDIDKTFYTSHYTENYIYPPNINQQQRIEKGFINWWYDGGEYHWIDQMLLKTADFFMVILPNIDFDYHIEVCRISGNETITIEGTTLPALPESYEVFSWMIDSRSVEHFTNFEQDLDHLDFQSKSGKIGFSFYNTYLGIREPNVSPYQARGDYYDL